MKNNQTNMNILKEVNILVVNDREDQLMVLETVLNPLEQNLIKAHSGQEALQILLRSSDFAVILLDVNMPIMNGFETAKFIRQHKKTQMIPIIFVTAVSFSLGDQFSGYALGAVDYIQSPFEPEILRAKVRALVDLYQKTIQVSYQAENLMVANKELKREIAKREAIEQSLQEKNVELENEIAQRLEIERDLRHSEKKFRQLSENIQEMFWISSFDTISDPGTEKFVYMSPIFEEIWGYSVSDLYKNPTSWMEVIDPEYYQYVTNERLALIKNEKKSISLEYKIKRPDGSIRWVFVRAFQVLDDAGKFYRVAGVATDITEHKHLREMAFQHKYHLELAELSRVSSMGEMASTLAHELNQPLTAITTYTQTCIRKLENMDKIDSGIIRAMKLVASQSERAGEIIHHMKNFVSKGSLKLDFLSLNNLIVDLKPLILYETKNTNIKIRFNLSPQTPATYMDKIQIEQIILNLVRNSVEAIHGANVIQPEIILQTALDNNEDVIHVCVIDNGPGFPEELTSSLFNPYVTTKSKGTGMGLAISRTIIEAHGGKLSAISNPGTTCFQFTLPIKEKNG